MEEIKLREIKKIKDGKFLKNYELYYTNKIGHDKTYEIVSYKDIHDISEIGTGVSGVVIAAISEGKLLLLKEFRMGVNRFVYNLCAGRREEGETLTQCAGRELYEETGLKLEECLEILPPAYGAVAMSDVSNQLVIARVSGRISDHTEEDELIYPALFDKDGVSELLLTEAFSARAQFVAYSFVKGIFDEYM